MDTPTTAPAWRIGAISSIPILPNIEVALRIESNLDTEAPSIPVPTNFGPKLALRTAQNLPPILTFSCDALISSEKQLNMMDTGSKDGDTGTNVANLAQILKVILATRQVRKSHLRWF